MKRSSKMVFMGVMSLILFTACGKTEDVVNDSIQEQTTANASEFTQGEIKENQILNEKDESKEDILLGLDSFKVLNNDEGEGMIVRTSDGENINIAQRYIESPDEYVQYIVEHDFDNDGEPELCIAQREYAHSCYMVDRDENNRWKAYELTEEYNKNEIGKRLTVNPDGNKGITIKLDSDDEEFIYFLTEVNDDDKVEAGAVTYSSASVYSEDAYVTLSAYLELNTKTGKEPAFEGYEIITRYHYEGKGIWKLFETRKRYDSENTILSDDCAYHKQSDGIYKITNKNGYSKEQIYKSDNDKIEKMELENDRLFFIKNGELWCINLNTKKDIKVNTNQNKNIAAYQVLDGRLYVRYEDDSEENGALCLDDDELDFGKPILKFTQTEADKYAAKMRSMILSNTNRVYDICNYTSQGAIAYIDLDGDGKAEKITLQADIEDVWNVSEMKLKINDSEEDIIGDRLDYAIRAVSLDGEHIYLTMYDDGPSADPYTSFMMYENGKIVAKGGLEADINEMEISDGSIKYDCLIWEPENNYIYKELIPNDKCELEWKKNEVYEVRAQHMLALLKEFSFYPDYKSDQKVTWKPQNIKFLAVTADLDYFLFENESGQRAWLKQSDVHENGYYDDLFEGRTIWG